MREIPWRCPPPPPVAADDTACAWDGARRDAHVIRNAGGRASDDAIRSLVISHKLLGTNEWFVVHHTNCGMEVSLEGVRVGGKCRTVPLMPPPPRLRRAQFFDSPLIGSLLATDLTTAAFDGKTFSNAGA